MDSTESILTVAVYNIQWCCPSPDITHRTINDKGHEHTSRKKYQHFRV